MTLSYRDLDDDKTTETLMTTKLHLDFDNDKIKEILIRENLKRVR